MLAMYRSGLVFLAIQLCIASECDKGSLVLSLFGTKNSTGSWDLFYDFDRNFCTSTESWRLDLVQDWNSGKRIRFKGSYRERIPELELKYATPILFGQNGKMEVLFITRNKGAGGETNGPLIPEAPIHPSAPPQSVETQVTAISETDNAKASRSPDSQLVDSDGVLKGDPKKRTEDGIITNEVEESSQSHTEAKGTKLEEHPVESSRAEAATGSTSEKTAANKREKIEKTVTDPEDAIRGKTDYNSSTVPKNASICSGYTSVIEPQMKVFTREEWKALKPKKVFDTFPSPAKFIFVTQTNVVCRNENICSEALRKMQRVLIDCFGDVYSNLYVDDGGRVYEGLGWERMRSNNSLFIHFLTDGWKLPSSETFASFAMLLWEGMRFDRISAKFQVIENKHLTKSFQKELQRWAQWSKGMWVGR